jgi:amino acid permease
VLQFWTPSYTWVISLVFWVFLVGVNAIHVKAYGELGTRRLLAVSISLNFFQEYWLSSLKVATVLIFIVLGVFVNMGFNQEHRFIGLSNWRIPGAPFVGGFGGFARVFVTASFACTPSSNSNWS